MHLSLPDIAARRGVVLKRQGSEWVACCPFHRERTPSFKIFAGYRGERFHCFGCGRSGDAVEFVALMEGVERGVARSIVMGAR